MANTNRVCMELPFNRHISYSQQLKAKEFWRFLDKQSNLKPYQVSLDKNVSIDDDGSRLLPFQTRGMWHEQFKVFQENGLDKVAFAAFEKCQMCSMDSNYGLSSSTDPTEQPYEELLHDMEVYDQKLIDEAIDVCDQTKNICDQANK